MVRVFRGLGRASDRDRHRRHRRHRHSAAGHGRGSAECVVAGHHGAALGAACPRLLDLDHPGPAPDRHEPDLVDLSRHRGAARRLRSRTDLPVRQRLAAFAGTSDPIRARIGRLHPALLHHPELRGPLARRPARRCGCRRRHRNPEDRLRLLYRLDVVLSDRLRRVGGNSDLPAVDVCVMDGRAARRRGRGQSGDLAGR